MTGGIASRPQEQKEFRGFCRLPSGEAVPLRASRPLRAASPRGLHGPGNSTGAQDARAGGGEAAAESRGGASRQLRSCLPGSRRAVQTPGLGWRPRSEARPPLEPARRPRAPGSRPGRHLPGPEATSSSSQTLPTVTCTAGRGRLNFSRASSQPSAAGERGRGTGGTAQLPGPRQGGTPASLGVGAARAAQGAGPSLAPPLPGDARAPPAPPAGSP